MEGKKGAKRVEGHKEGRVEGRKEGREEGRSEQREEQLRRIEEAYERYGREVDGEMVLPRTPEVERFLSGESDGEA